MIKVVQWKTGGPEFNVYRLDEDGAGDRLFRDLENNAEIDGRDKLEVVEITEAQWAECLKTGEEWAGSKQ